MRWEERNRLGGLTSCTKTEEVVCLGSRCHARSPLTATGTGAAWTLMPCAATSINYDGWALEITLTLRVAFFDRIIYMAQK